LVTYYISAQRQFSSQLKQPVAWLYSWNARSLLHETLTRPWWPLTLQRRARVAPPVTAVEGQKLKAVYTRETIAVYIASRTCIQHR